MEWDQQTFKDWVEKVRGNRKVEEAQGVRAVIILDVWKVSAISLRSYLARCPKLKSHAII